MSDEGYGVDVLWEGEPCPDLDDKLVFPASSGRLITGSPVNDLEYNAERAKVKGIPVKPVDVSKIGKI